MRGIRFAIDLIEAPRNENTLVVHAGPEFGLLHTNRPGHWCTATLAVVDEGGSAGIGAGVPGILAEGAREVSRFLKGSVRRARPNRRGFLANALQATGALLGASRPNAGTALGVKLSAPLPRPKFYWGVGIENCWIAQTDPKKDGNRRLLDVFLQMQHYQKWKADLDLAKEVGFNAIRYSVPWYKAEPKPGVYDWSWIDKPVEYLVEQLKIVPIMDLIHYGTPAWMADGVGDDRFPETIARYARAMAIHFKGLVDHYSPHNEPGLTCLFCGLHATWPPYHKRMESWAKIGIRVAKGMVLEMEAIRAVLPGAIIVSVDPFFYGAVDRHLPPAPEGDPARRELLRAAAAYPASLAYGKVTAEHPLAELLRDCGVQKSDIGWFAKRCIRPDILGCNCYPGMRLVGGGTKDANSVTQAAQEAAERVKGAILEAHSYYDLPVYLTETSAGDTDEAKVAYIDALAKMVQGLHRQKVPLVGVNWWPLFETIQWDYRDKPDKPLVDFIYPGGWNNGLYKIRPQPDGDLKRVPTPAVQAYQRLLRHELR